MYSATYVWAKVIPWLENRLSAPLISSWFEDAEAVSFQDNVLTLYTPSAFNKDSIERCCTGYIQEAGRELFGQDLQLVVVCEPVQPAAAARNNDLIDANQQFTFDTFIVGNSNRFAHAVALAVSREPGGPYNPLFIYGPSGLGKTHLLYAIANAVRRDHPDFRIVYKKGDEFTNELINSLQEGKNIEFRNQYRNADILLIDDIQFIAGKERTEEEFFHTFNTLFEMKKQIVLTSDRPPREILRLTDRLVTRFEWGMLADVQPPDYETRMAIIRNKCISLGLELPDDVADYIATNITSNIRQIEGSVRKLQAHVRMGGFTMTVSNVAKVIRDMYTTSAEAMPTPDLIISQVALYYGVDEAAIRGKHRGRNVIDARQMAMYLIRTMTNLSLPDIGKAFDKNHTTVLHSIKQVEEALAEGKFTDVVRDITTNINDKL